MSDVLQCPGGVARPIMRACRARDPGSNPGPGANKGVKSTGTNLDPLSTPSSYNSNVQKVDMKNGGATKEFARQNLSVTKS